MSNVVEFKAKASAVAPACYTINETSALLRLSRVTLYAMIKRGDLKTVRIGCFQRVPASEIDRLVTPPPAA
jgi:excisionase family DNA binding protein